MRPVPRLALVSIATVVVVGAALVARQAQTPAGGMADAANSLLTKLGDGQKKRIAFALDDPHRTAWFFTPQQDAMKNATRKGVPVGELDGDQKDAVRKLLQAGLSATGYDQAETIMSLESVLASMEKNGRMVRDPNWYFVSIFGTPSATGKWGWRFEGHHMSLNFTLDKGAVVSATPLMFGSNPAVIKDGPRAGERPLPETELPAQAIIASLTDDQKKTAVQPTQLPEIKENSPTADVGEPVGLKAGEMTGEQKVQLRKLLEAYANRLPKSLANAELDKVEKAGFDQVRFAYHVAADEPGKPYTYRVQGPTFVVEFLNTQADAAGNPANHVHSAWRRIPADFGIPEFKTQ